jgi:hypothetical protein
VGVIYIKYTKNYQLKEIIQQFEEEESRQFNPKELTIKEKD